jgi:hypothetical protein
MIYVQIPKGHKYEGRYLVEKQLWRWFFHNLDDKFCNLEFMILKDFFNYGKEKETEKRD